MRTIIELTDEQLERLTEFCAREGLSRAAAIRRAVDDLVSRDRSADLRKAAGTWKHKGIDGVEFQRAMRAEWDR